MRVGSPVGSLPWERHPELRLVRLLLRDPFRGLLPPILILLREKIRKLKTPLCRPQLRPWLILFFRVFLKQQPHLPILHLDLLIFLPLQASQTLRLPRDRFWPGAMPCQIHFLTLKRGSPSASKMEGFVIPFCLLSTGSRGYPTRLLREKELKANPDILDLLRNKVPDFRHLPISIKEGISIERSLRSCLESHNFLTWSVMALIKSLHEKKLLPKDDPVISQLQKSFSKACSNVTNGLTANTAFVTMKRRQLLLSHVVPSVSEAQKRNLLSDPFFQTSSLFDASSVESARSAARDLSLFKPHLKASSSTSQSRRQTFSSSSGLKGPARPSSRPSSSQRSSSPPRQQFGRKDGSRFQKKSSGTPHKRGGIRK